MNRRQLLRLVTAASTALALDPADGLDWDRLSVGSARLDSATLEGYTALNRQLWQMFRLSPTKSVVLPLVRQQFQTPTNALRQPGSSATRDQVCALVADVLQLGGEILFDGDAYTAAAHCYTVAASAAQQAGAYDLWSCALTRHAFIALYDRHSDQATELLRLAAAAADRGDRQLSTRQWVAAVQAQVRAADGDLDGCQRALDVAETVGDLRGQVHTDGWLRFDGSRLAEERGARYAELGQAELADSILAEALLHAGSARRRGSILVDLALVGAHQRDVDKVVTHASAALQLGRQTGSGYIARRLDTLRPYLVPIATDRRVGEQLPELVRTTG